MLQSARMLMGKISTEAIKAVVKITSFQAQIKEKYLIVSIIEYHDDFEPRLFQLVRYVHCIG